MYAGVLNVMMLETDQSTIQDDISCTYFTRFTKVEKKED